MEYKGKAIQCSNLDNNLVELIFDSQGESVNKFDQNSLEELREVVTQLAADKSVSGLLVTSGKGVFIVGADITEFLKGFQVPQDELVQWVRDGQQVFTDLENLHFPSVCAINGYALGGGFEFGLACTYKGGFNKSHSWTSGSEAWFAARIWRHISSTASSWGRQRTGMDCWRDRV